MTTRVFRHAPPSTTGSAKEQDVQSLRDLHAEMDRAILTCHGWQDIDLGHDFHQNQRGQTRFTISPEARREVLRRLLELNLKLAGEPRPGVSRIAAKVGRGG